MLLTNIIHICKRLTAISIIPTSKSGTQDSRKCCESASNQICLILNPQSYPVLPITHRPAAQNFIDQYFSAYQARMVLETIFCIVVVGVIAHVVDEVSQPKIGLPRIGAKPGPFNLLK